MNIADTIRQSREARGLTQEDLAERLEVSRQAVSKWEVGASVPTPENLKTLSEILEVAFETEEGGEAPPSAPKPPFWNWKRTALLVLGVLVVSALFSIAMWTALKPEKNVDMPRHAEPYVTGVYFFNEDGTPLEPDRGDNWQAFAVGRRVYLLVSFQQGTETGVQGVSLFATPTGTEVYDQREQLALQAVYDRTFALFPLDFPEETMIHLDVTLECDLDQRVTETLNVIAVPEEDLLPAP
nr:helix-turn-helix transcriptional regulator [uncultured Oscillibacter sp.]